MTLAERIKDKAVELGFDLVGIGPAQRSVNAEAFESWLAEGHHGEMAWLERDPARRSDPRAVVPGARSVISVGLSYYAGEPDPQYWDDPLRGRIARYAWGRDYHKIMPRMLKQLAEFLEAESGSEISSRVYVDTGPVLEHDAAASAGLGFTGKHTLTISPLKGSYLFLGEILSTAELDLDVGATERGTELSKTNDAGRVLNGTCGSCRRCLNVCPTHAFPAAYVLDGRRCISYLTIELRDAIPEELRPKMKNWIYGCDECQSVCPWVQRVNEPRQDDWMRCEPDIYAPDLFELMALDDEGFIERFAGRPIVRTKRRGLLRNAAIALGNSGCAEAIPVLEKALQDQEPLIREAATWALEQLRDEK